MLEMNIEYQEL